jgi:hypothetical protein
MVYRPLGFQRNSKGITRNGNASRVWKGEIVQIAIAFWAPPLDVPIFLSKNWSTIR